MSPEDLIKRYIVEERGYQEIPAELLFQKIVKYDDIKDEFIKWLERRDFNFEPPLVVEGYSALAIADLAPWMDGLGVYNFLVDLRTQPKKAQAIITEGFKVR